MTDESHDQEQNRRIRDLESRVNVIENQLASIITKLDTLTSIGKGLAILAGAAVGIDVIPMLGAGV